MSPHPRRDPKGHSYGVPEPKPPPVDSANWRGSDIYRFGIDLYNHAYWWECHESLEALWHAVGHTTPVGQFLQGVIQVAAGNLKKFSGMGDVARELAAKGLARHAGLPDPFMGVDLARFKRETGDYFSGARAIPSLIALSP